ncbi:hypothetical protein JCM15765_29370 [Paradesulfitobacterium aromaticivorans]
MSDYYYYLVRTTWPYLFVLFFMLTLVGFKFVQISVKTLRSGRGLRAVPLWLTRVLFWMGILGIYLMMFMPANRDWLAQPALVEGRISGIDTMAGERVLIKLEEGSGEVTGEVILYADSEFAATVQLGDEVRLTYLAHKKEIVKCVIK